MALSVLDLFSVGIGPSSSHTVGPMRAARRFVTELADTGRLRQVTRVRAELFGSLGATGHGHGSGKAVILGLQGDEPATVDVDTADQRADHARQLRQLQLAGHHRIDFDPDDDLVAVGADLEPGTVLAAYRRGLFPMPVGGRRQPMAWWSPARRTGR